MDAMTDFTAGSVNANGINFHYLEMGHGPLALCLHGFPDHAWSFRHLLPDLAAAGFRAVAPFMRGYAPTTAPADGRYHTALLARDAVALIDALGAERGLPHRQRLGRRRRGRRHRPGPGKSQPPGPPSPPARLTGN